MQTGVAEIPYNWRKARLGYPREMPPVAFLQAKAVSVPAERSVFLPWGAWSDIAEVRDWLADNLPSGLRSVQLFARFAWRRGLYETKKEFLGLRFVFAHALDLVHFKLRWQP